MTRWSGVFKIIVAPESSRTALVFGNLNKMSSRRNDPSSSRLSCQALAKSARRSGCTSLRPWYRLASGEYQGDNCLAPPHDALLEAGHPELAEHFRQEDVAPERLLGDRPADRPKVTWRPQRLKATANSDGPELFFMGRVDDQTEGDYTTYNLRNTGSYRKWALHESSVAIRLYPD